MPNMADEFTAQLFVLQSQKIWNGIFPDTRVMKREFLGEFEELVLTAVAALSENAYGHTVTNAITELTGREVSVSTVHTTLYRLEDKGLLHSELSSGESKRGGRSKRIFKATVSGLATLRNMKSIRESLWKLIPVLNR